MATQTRDMTQGSPAKLILLFALPLMLGNVFQQLYTVVDTIVVGQFVGVEALAALGSAEWLLYLVIGIITGVTQGFSILIAQRFGADDQAGLRRAIGASALLTAITTVLAMGLSLIVLRQVLVLLETPANILEMAVQYLTVMFAGLPVIAGYNLCASVLRAIGNSRTPLVAMLCASGINVGLDLLFVIVFRWGVIGAAAATLIAQGFACAVCFFAMRKLPYVHLDRQDWKPQLSLWGHLMRLAMPMAFQNIIIGVGGLVVQYVINTFGFIFVAGFTATNKLYGILEVAATSFGFAMATYTGQNLGAGRIDRIKAGTRKGSQMAVGTALVITVCMLALGKPILGLFISGEPEVAAQVLEIAYIYLAVMSSMLFILYLLYVYRSALQGMGDTVIPMISAIVEMIMRMSVVLILPKVMGQNGVYLAEVSAWIGAVALLTTAYYVRIHRLEREGAGNFANNPEEEGQTG